MFFKIIMTREMIADREMALAEIVGGWGVIYLWWKLQKMCHTARPVKSCSDVSCSQLQLRGYRYKYSNIRHQSNHKTSSIFLSLVSSSTTALDQRLTIYRGSSDHSLGSTDNSLGPADFSWQQLWISWLCFETADLVLKQLIWIHSR